jgi:hypothetical protein
MLFGEAIDELAQMLSACRTGSKFAIITAIQAQNAGVEGSLHILLPYRGRDLADVDFRSTTWLRASA